MNDVTSIRADQLEPPDRGDRIASALVTLGLVIFAVTIAAFYVPALSAWQELSTPLLILNVLGLVLTGFAFLWSLIVDLTWLSREEDDITYVFGPGSANVDSVLVDRPNDFGFVGKIAVALSRFGKAERRRAETLVDDRVLRVRRVAEGTAHEIDEGELRAIAALRSASLGSCARYISGVLLLLTVLGTFIGVKAALPQLIEALRQATNQGPGGANALAEALEAVTSAFGSNLSALICSISLGVAAFGLSSGRQNMLARLEQVSTAHIYQRLPKGTESALKDSVTAISKMAGNMDVFGTRMDEFADQMQRLRESIDHFGGGVEDSLDSSASVLRELLQAQSTATLQESKKALSRLDTQIGDVVAAVSQSTTQYAALVGMLTSRGDTLAEIATEMHAATRELHEARARFGEYADSATRTMSDRLGSLAESSQRQAISSESLVVAYDRIDKGMASLLKKTESIADGFQLADERRDAALADLARTTASNIAAPIGRAVEGLAERMVELKRVTDGVPAEVSRGVRDALEKDRAAVRAATPTDIALSRVATALEGLHHELSQPMWRRLLRFRD